MQNRKKWINEAATQPRILFVADDSRVMSSLRQTIAAMNFDALTARSCATARILADATPFDILCCDSELPDGNGVELARELRAAMGCKVVIISAHSLGGQDLPGGIDGWLVKPVLLSQLRGVLAQCLAFRAVPPNADHSQ